MIFPILTRRAILARAAALLVCLVAGEECRGQMSSGFRRDAPAPLSEVVIDPVPERILEAGGLTDLNLRARATGRAALILDSTRLAPFAKGSFMPAAIPVEGEPFFEFGERATLQGNGSAVMLSARPRLAGESVYTEAWVQVDEVASDGSFSVSTRAFVQYDKLVVGVTETAFADDGVTVPILDLACPNGTVTAFNPTGGGGQGRLSSFLYPLGSEGPVIGNVSLETPTPEIRFPAGETIDTTFSTFSRVPDFITTWRYRDGEVCEVNKEREYNEFRHLQVGAVLRDLGLKNGDKSIDDTVFGWGVQVSGWTQLFIRPESRFQDAIGFSATFGEGIGHYINDLHVLVTDRTAGGNDAVLNGAALEVLPAQAYYLGYLHHWNDSWQSSVAYSHVNLDPAAGQVNSAYRHGDFAVVNLLYHRDSGLAVKQFIAGLEYLFGQKEDLDGSTGDAHRLMFVVNITHSAN